MNLFLRNSIGGENVNGQQKSGTLLGGNVLPATLFVAHFPSDS